MQSMQKFAKSLHKLYVTFFFSSNCRIVYRGVKRLLTVKDFLPLAVKLKSSYAYEIFSKYWKFHL